MFSLVQYRVITAWPNRSRVNLAHCCNYTVTIYTPTIDELYFASTNKISSLELHFKNFCLKLFHLQLCSSYSRMPANYKILWRQSYIWVILYFLLQDNTGLQYWDLISIWLKFWCLSKAVHSECANKWEELVFK